jgi:hypothetical protein
VKIALMDRIITAMLQLLPAKKTNCTYSKNLDPVELCWLMSAARDVVTQIDGRTSGVFTIDHHFESGGLIEFPTPLSV